jgi:O-antigen/teichoic acid export membrane protein
VQVVESVLETGAGVVLVLLGGGAAGAAFGRAIGYVVGAAFAMALATRLLGRDILPRSLRGSIRTRAIAGYAGALLIVDSAYTLFGQIDILLIGAIRSVAEVGLFQAPLRLQAFLAYPGLAVATAVAPRIGGTEDPDMARDRFQRALRGLILLDAAMAAPVVAWAEPLVRLGLGRSYAGSAPVLRALAPYVLLGGIAPMVSISLNYLGRARERVPIAVATVAINALIDALLIPRIGVVGGAVGTDVAFALYVTGHLVLCRRRLQLELRPLGITFLRAILAGAAATGVLALAGTHGARWVLGGIAGIVAFAAVVFLTREITVDELRAAMLARPLGNR